MAASVATSRADADAVQRDLGSGCPVGPAGPGDTVGGVAPSLVARPASAGEVCAVMGAAARHGLAVVPRGAGTKLAWGRPPERVDLVVDTTAMGAVVDHAAGDLIVEVQAGARLAEVNAVVADAGQRLALDVTHPGATVGGTLGANASGPLRRSVGTARDLMIGCSVVRADGVLSHAGGRVVKNVAGYDVGKLTIGSLGTLAVITRAVFRLHPLPPARALVTVVSPTGEHAGAHGSIHDAVHAVVHSQLVPAAVELDQGGAGDGPARLHVLLEGTEGGVAARTRGLLALLGDDAEVSHDLPEGWGRPPFPDGGTGMKLTFALSGLGAVLGALAAAGAATGLRPAVRGSAGSGVLMVGLGADAEPGAVAEVLVRVRAVCSEHGGAAVVLTAPPAVEAALTGAADAWGPVPALALMRAVKDRFDPERRLAPGRFVGGI